VSNVDDSYPEFDDSELSDLDSGLPELPEEPGQPDEAGALSELEPSEPLSQSGDEALGTEATEQWPAPEGEGAEAGLEGPASTEVATDVEEEKPEEEEEEEEKEKGPGLLARVAKTSPYVVLLGISLLAIMIGILCLWLELQSYDFAINAEQVDAPVEVPFAPPSTTATA
jgi:hypothetical protein